MAYTEPNQPPIYTTGTTLPAPTPPRKSWHRFIWPVAAAVCLVGWIATAASGGGTPSAAGGPAVPAPTVTLTVAPEFPVLSAAPISTKPPATKAPVKPAVATSIGDGTWQVGTDMQVGTYVGTVPADSTGCYWERDKNADGSFDSIIANDNVNPGGRVILSVTKATKFVTLNGCGTLHRR